MDGKVPVLGAQKDRHCGDGDRAWKTTLREKTPDSGGRMWCRRTRPTPSATQKQQGSAVPPIRSPSRATASQCWFLKGEAAGSARYAVQKVSPGATSLYCAACSFRSADVGCSRLFDSHLDISFTQVSLPLKCSLEFHFLSLLYPTFHDAHEG